MASGRRGVHRAAEDCREPGALTPSEVQALLTEGLTLKWWVYLLILLVAGAASWIGAYFGGYAGEKGRNLATKEDFKEILRQLEATTRATEEIRAAVSRDTLE